MLFRSEIYEALGVPEVWRYTKRQGLMIYGLNANGYEQVETSVAFPQMSGAQLNEFLVQRQSQSENQVMRSVRSWTQQLSAN